jgi:hypothetical protein
MITNTLDDMITSLAFEKSLESQPLDFCMPVERRDVLCYGVVRPCVRPWSFQFSGLCFAIFAAIGLKLGVLLCSQELLFQFTFRCD